MKTDVERLILMDMMELLIEVLRLTEGGDGAGDEKRGEFFELVMVWILMKWEETDKKTDSTFS